MPSFSVPEAVTSSFSLTLGQVLQRVRDSVVKSNATSDTTLLANWSLDQQRQALEQGLACCAPLGVESDLSATSNGSDRSLWTIDARLVKLTDVWVSTPFQGVTVVQPTPITGVEVSASPSGTAVIKFQRSIAEGSTVRVKGLWHFGLPSTNNEIVPWPWPDLLIAYTVAELYRLGLNHGISDDEQSYSQMEQNWRMRADQRKMELMTLAGFPPPPQPTDKKPFEKRRS